MLWYWATFDDSVASFHAIAYTLPYFKYIYIGVGVILMISDVNLKQTTGKLTINSNYG